MAPSGLFLAARVADRELSRWLDDHAVLVEDGRMRLGLQCVA